MNLKAGIPFNDEYQELLNDSSFKAMDAYVESFLKTHREALDPYQKQWIANPFRQWSRQWEYPYVYQEIRKHIESSSAQKTAILDAGSGVTFFPQWLTERHPDVNVSCCDMDASYPPMYEQIYGENKRVNFQLEDLRALSYPAERFDILYCISVLEHTENYEEILKEFHRCLKPEGRLILTFDIALQDSADIPLKEAEILLERIEHYFTTIEELPSIAPALKNNCVNTLQFPQTHPQLLPWKYPFLSHLKSALKRKRLPVSRYKPLTFYCLSVVKKD